MAQDCTIGGYWALSTVEICPSFAFQPSEGDIKEVRRLNHELADPAPFLLAPFPGSVWDANDRQYR